MPIKFACDSCGQRLSVSSKKAGARAKCPKCGEPLTVPEQSDDGSQQAVAEPGLDPFAEFAVYDDETEWVYESEEAGSESAEVEATRIDYDRVAVPRNILYLQGGLLASVAFFCFVMGLIFGRLSGPTVTVDTGPQPCVIEGRIAFDDGNAEVPDEGAIVIVVPEDRLPEQLAKVPMDSVIPTSARDAAANHRGRDALRGFGGDLARVSLDGSYQLKVPDHGNYYLLILSRNKPPSRGAAIDTDHLAEVGRYFSSADELLQQYSYQWKLERMTSDRTLNHVF